jgi:hypothetical protein
MHAALAGTAFEGRIVAARQDRVIGPFAVGASTALVSRPR